jgi:hypothetical protein
MASAAPARACLALVLQRHLGECIAAALVVADAGLVLTSSPPA